MFSFSAGRDLLKDMVGHMTPKVGLVLQMPYCCDRKGFAGVYEKVCKHSYYGDSLIRSNLSKSEQFTATIPYLTKLLIQFYVRFKILSLRLVCFYLILAILNYFNLSSVFTLHLNAFNSSFTFPFSV